MKYFCLLLFTCAIQAALSQELASLKVQPAVLESVRKVQQPPVLESVKDVQQPSELESVRDVQQPAELESVSEVHQSDVFKSVKKVQQPVVLGSVRDGETGDQKCIGIFVSSDTLLTSAKCVLCFYLDKNCNMTVQVKLNKDEVAQYKIKEVKIHENYDENPFVDNIGLIFLENKIENALVMGIPDKPIDTSNVRIYSLMENTKKNHFNLEVKEVQVVPLTKCDLATRNYISSTQICTYSAEEFLFTEEDEGSPIVYLKSNNMYLLGRFLPTIIDAQNNDNVAVYQTIVSLSEWIKRNMKNETKPTVILHNDLSFLKSG